jgi:acyl-CoA synthetase (AMP-forming)/AMP-acid ligase II
MDSDERSLTDWIWAPDEQRGAHFTKDGDTWEYSTYVELSAHARRFAMALLQNGVTGGEVVPIVLTSGSAFVAAFFGSLLIGATPAPIAPPMVFQNRDAYRRHLIKLLGICGAAVVVTESELLAQIDMSNFTERLLIAEAYDTGAVLSEAPELLPDSLGLLQFTSGSSGHVRGVQVPVAALEANINAIRRWTRCTRDDHGAMWLPVHHDMGLIGNLLMAIMSGMNAWIFRPEHFIADPMRWLRIYGEKGARLGAAPNFGLGYVVRRVEPKDLKGMDFSNWGALVCGAERVDKHTIDAFSALLAPAGFDRRAVLPAYGLAEATLAVCGKPLEADIHSVRMDSRALSVGRPVAVLDTDSTDEQWLVGCGQPVDERASVTIVDADGDELPAGVLGEIAVAGPSVAAGYASGSSESSSTRFTKDRLLTGDAGFMLDGQLYVVGRFGDSLKVRGKTVFAEDIEALLHMIPGLGPHNAVALLGLLDGRDTVIALVERDKGDWIGQIAARLRTIDPDLRVRIISASKGDIKRTTSGKPRRRPMWDAQVAGGRPAVVYDSADGEDTGSAAGAVTQPATAS